MNSALDFILQILLPLLFSFGVSAIISWKLIPFLKRVKGTQTIHEDVPDSHHRKAGTPTMGGIAIIAGCCFGSIAAMAFSGFSANIMVVLIVMLIFGFVGFFDDYKKVANRRNLGLTAKQKLLLQLVVALGVAFYYLYIAGLGTRILIPFLWRSVDIGFWIIPYIVFIIVAMVNSVNLTDGLDGLAGGVTTILSIFYPLFAIFGLGLGISLYPVEIDGFGGLAGLGSLAGIGDAVFFIALAGACLGFLLFNRYPARIFMGDTGSLALGGGIAAGAIFSHLELLLPIVGLIFVLEALSDIIQVGSYKLRHGKRVFKMAPLHHHFEKSGWHERKVVYAFTGVTLALCLLSAFAMVIQTLW
jgi:phospho-N-acetylmuramoyl-pentapeptide-transferase